VFGTFNTVSNPNKITPFGVGATIRLCPLEISRNFLKSVEWAASHPSYIQSAHALTIVPKEKR